MREIYDSLEAFELLGGTQSTNNKWLIDELCIKAIYCDLQAFLLKTVWPQMVPRVHCDDTTQPSTA